MKGNRYIIVEKECCGTCVHYRQHYIASNAGRFHPIWYGHCGTPRMKRREPDSVCPHWSPAVPPEQPEEDRCPPEGAS